MSRPPALDAALEAAQRARARCEAFARSSETWHLRRDASGCWETRDAREIGIACRVASPSGNAFAVASGGSARYGSNAVRAALESVLPGDDPLPPASELGTTPIPPVPAPSSDEARRAFVEALAGAVDAVRPPVALVELRLLEGRATSWIATSDGFTATQEAGAASVELLLAPGEGPWRLTHASFVTLADADPAHLAEQACAAALLAPRGGSPRRHLCDVLLAPAVAAPLVAALARHLVATPPDGAPHASKRVKVSPVWELTDERPGPDGMLPLSWDGEGLPARRITLLSHGRLRERLASWADVQRTRVAAGGAVRRSLRDEPGAGPANLVVRAAAPLSEQELLAALDEGVYLACPAGAPRVDEHTGAFSLRCAAVGIHRGRAATAHPLVELRGSLPRLLAGLAAAGDRAERFSLECAVTTPSLLVRRLEIA
ncbi:MAG: metallopeptidase TldD-related protein [Acidobacteriota bacterium]